MGGQADLGLGGNQGKMEFPNWEILKKIENGEIEIVWGRNFTF